VKILCCLCGQPMEIDSPSGEPYVTEPSGWIPTLPQAAIAAGYTLPNPSVALQNAPPPPQVSSQVTVPGTTTGTTTDYTSPPYSPGRNVHHVGCLGIPPTV
jgi:hypothetical protein